MRIFLLAACLLCSATSIAQSNLYYPPILTENWDTVSPTSLGWCPEKVDSLLTFLHQKNSKSFIVLHQGKIAVEAYFDDFERDSVWYWASSGKSLMAFLVGMAQDEGLLSIEDSTSQYLGLGWTGSTPAQEGAIKIRHQLSMNTGLDDNVANKDCLIDSCLQYLTDPETRWAYYNAPYRLLQDVVANASGQTINAFTQQRMLQRIGMKGLWFNYVRFGRARDMARFGLLMLGEGVWDGDTLLHDRNYFQSMITPSQSLNQSYGYLWWLNGQGSHMLPTVQFQFQSDLIPAAPNDCYAALGKNDQKIYVVPSLDLVVVRQGNASGDSQLAVSSFDNQLWEHLNEVFCSASTPIESSFANSELLLFPNPTSDRLSIAWERSVAAPSTIKIFDLQGRMLVEKSVPGGQNEIQVELKELKRGLYLIRWEQDGKWVSEKFWKD
ncbi:MAG: serine hydrolase [Bacteroidota bacterium]